MNDYRCEGCNGYIIVGQHIVLKTTVVSVEYQQLGESALYHDRCYPPPEVPDDDDYNPRRDGRLRATANDPR